MRWSRRCLRGGLGIEERGMRGGGMTGMDIMEEMIGMDITLEMIGMGSTPEMTGAVEAIEEVEVDEADMGDTRKSWCLWWNETITSLKDRTGSG